MKRNRFLTSTLALGAAMKDAAAKATQNAGPLKDSAAKLAAEFKSLGLAMSAVTPAAK